MAILKISDTCFQIPDGVEQLFKTRTWKMEFYSESGLSKLNGMLGSKSIGYIERMYLWLTIQYEKYNGFDDEQMLYAIHLLETIYPYANCYKNHRWEFIENPEIDLELGAMNQCMELMDIEKLNFDQIAFDDSDCILSEENIIQNQWAEGWFQ